MFVVFGCKRSLVEQSEALVSDAAQGDGARCCILLYDDRSWAPLDIGARFETASFALER